MVQYDRMHIGQITVYGDPRMKDEIKEHCTRDIRGLHVVGGKGTVGQCLIATWDRAIG